MNSERCLHAGEAVGLGYAALNRATQYAKDRVVFGRKIGKNQGIQHALADSWMKLEAAKLATMHAAKLCDFADGRKVVGAEDEEVVKAARMELGAACNLAVGLAAEAAFEACERAVCIFHFHFQFLSLLDLFLFLFLWLCLGRGRWDDTSDGGFGVTLNMNNVSRPGQKMF